ncbi:hypothetical protein MGH68_11335 [Erysipelothrix sp. D19-032]
MLQYDDLAVLPLDFSERIQALKQALDLEMASEYIDINAFKDPVITIANQSNALYTLLTNINGTGEHETLKQQVRKIFRFARQHSFYDYRGKTMYYSLLNRIKQTFVY